MNKTQTFTIRGFVRPGDGGVFVGVCLRPYLVVEGETEGEAMHKLHQLIKAYVVDAFKDGTLDEFMRRRAPLALYAQYAGARVMHVLSSSFRPFTETCQLPKHA